MESKINNVMRKFDFKGQAGSLQYWEYKQVGQKKVLSLVGQPILSTQGQKGLKNYRKRSFNYTNASVGPDTEVDQEWLAGLAAQKRVPRQRTSRDPNQILGQLVVPVFSYQGADEKFVGVIELTTALPKTSYDEEFNQIQNLLKNENLTKPLENTIKVIYGDDIYKFQLPLPSGIADVWENMKMRNSEVNQKTFRLECEDGSGYLICISSDDDLRARIANSSTKAIYMFLKRGD
ncbi:hypothetical protein M8C21_018921 [Ambrosia artemisiifolia]|uniref:PB1 domain-containing protein n=1 Tax=Ambrosia artemisiifolia TaxID=4212 RepID=A0AAD5GX35_AMBAR|nr:hypothetical protein M8C21_018921 [Ambrosia artemisiifolia]